MEQGDQQPIPTRLATTHNITKQECFDIPGAQSWSENKGQERVPKEQRLGTCYHEGVADELTRREL